ncbi:unnamed protein product, partial [Ectocarpus sp. 13 AM-2016]
LTRDTPTFRLHCCVPEGHDKSALHVDCASKPLNSAERRGSSFVFYRCLHKDSRTAEEESEELSIRYSDQGEATGEDTWTPPTQCNYRPLPCRTTGVFVLVLGCNNSVPLRIVARPGRSRDERRHGATP